MKDNMLGLKGSSLKSPNTPLLSYSFKWRSSKLLDEILIVLQNWFINTDKTPLVFP